MTARRTSSGSISTCLTFCVEQALELAGGELLFAVVDAAGVYACLEKLPGADAGELDGVLEGEEQAHAGADFRLEGQQVLAVVDGLAGGDGVVGTARQHVSQACSCRSRWGP